MGLSAKLTNELIVSNRNSWEANSRSSSQDILRLL
jgi:hypothetical protein